MQEREFIFAEMPWFDSKAHVYTTTWKTSESHLLSVTMNMPKQRLSDSKAAHKNYLKKKKKRFHMTVLLSH